MFVIKLKILYISDHTIWLNFFSMGSKYVPNNVWTDFILLVSEFATIARKSFNVKFTTKIDFSDHAFYVIINDPDIGILNLLTLYLISI